MWKYRKHTSNSYVLRSMFLAAVSVGLMILMGPVQDTGDDAIMAWQLSRGLGSLATFISPYLSLFMSALYHHFPVFPWWSLLHVAGAWTLLTVALQLIMKAQYTGKDRRFLYLLLFGTVWLTVMRRVNFTRTAAAFATAGILLCLQYIFSENFGKRVASGSYIAGICLCIVGCMIRFQGGIMILLFLFIVLFMWKMTAGNRRIKTANRKICIVVLTLVLVVLCLQVADKLFWDRSPDWQVYQSENEARSDILDYIVLYPEWEDAKEEYMACGLRDKEDWYMFVSKGYMGDPDVYPLDVLKAVGELSGKYLSIQERFILAFRAIKIMLAESKILLWVLLSYFYLFYPNSRKFLIINMVISGSAFFMMIALGFRGKVVFRVWEPIFMCVLLTGILVSVIIRRSPNPESSRIKTRGGKIRKWFCLVLAVVLMFYTGIVQDLCHLKLPDAADDRDEFSRARAEYIQATPERIYLLSQPIFHNSPNVGPFGIWERLPENYLKNYFALSNWDSNSPVHINDLKRLGITNPTKALIQRTDTYAEFMDDKTYLFLRRHYGSNITCSFVDEFPDGGAVLQYTAPIVSKVVPVTSDTQTRVILLKSEEDPRYQIKTWNMEGRIDGWDGAEDCEALYCDIRKADGQRYTFRLAFEEDGSFHGFFYDIDEEWMENVMEAEIVSLRRDGRYECIGECRWKGADDV